MQFGNRWKHSAVSICQLYKRKKPDVRNQAFCVQNDKEMNMNMLTEFNSNVKTMSSREIAELCEKQHGHVCRDIESLNEIYLKMGLSKIGEGYYTHPNTGSQQHREFILNKDQCVDLVTGYKPEVRIRINRRWSELEEQNKQPRELSRLEIIRIALEAEEENQALRGQISVLEPKAQALEVFANTDSTYTIRDCAKTIGISEKKLIQLLLDKGWVYRDQSKRLQPYSQKCDQKIFINRPSKVIKNSAGEEHVYLHMRVTAYGLTRITGLVNKMKKVAA